MDPNIESYFVWIRQIIRLSLLILPAQGDDQQAGPVSEVAEGDFEPGAQHLIDEAFNFQ